MRALVLSPHTDDGELGCGAYISRLIAEGYEVRYLAFSYEYFYANHQSNLTSECIKSLEVLGIEDRLLMNFEARNFAACRQEILDHLIIERDSFCPEIVLTPMLNDVHQDHQVVAQEAKRAFKHCTVLGYEIPWNLTTPTLNAFIPVTESSIQLKVSAFHQYKSQKNRLYWNGAIEALAIVRGVQAGSRFAEAFEVIRWQIANDV